MKGKSRKGPSKTQISVRIDNRIMAAFQELQQTTGWSKDQMIEEGFPLALQRYLKMDPLTKEVRRICNAATLDEDWLLVCFLAYLRLPFAETRQMTFPAALEIVKTALRDGDLTENEVRSALEDEHIEKSIMDPDPLQDVARKALLDTLRLLPTMPWFNDVLATYKAKPVRRGRRKAQEE
jgi:hypothetical protein